MPGLLRTLIPGLLFAAVLLTLAAGLFYQLAIQPGVSGISVGSRFPLIIGWTTLQATLSTVLSVSLGIILAWALSHRAQFRGRSIYIALLSSALVLPSLVVVLGLVTVLGRSGWVSDILRLLTNKPLTPFIYGLGGILIAHCYFNVSFAARNILQRFEAIPADRKKLAASLGLNSWQRFKLIELPAITAGLPTLATTIFLLCFTSFAIVLTLGGSPRYNTLEVSIYEAIKLDFDLGRALGLALAQLTICGILVMCSVNTGSSNALIDSNNERTLWHDSKAAFMLQVAIILIFGLAFVLPLAAVVFDGFTADFANLTGDSTFQLATITSLLLASASTVLVLLISVSMAITYTTLATPQRLGRHWLSKPVLRALRFSSTLYLAVPSLVLGLGFFLLARRIGGSYNHWAVVALLTANVLMVLPFALATLAPAMMKAANRYDKLAASLGLSGWSRWRLIESALVHKELTYIACLAFCMSLGDLGVIALFGNNDFVTLPWLLYQKMGSYRTQDAAGIALIMLAITLAVFLLAPKLLWREHVKH